MTSRDARKQNAWDWIFGILVALDILLGALLGALPGVDPLLGETVSHMANRHLDTWGGPLCAVLGVIDKDHCAEVEF